MANRTLDEIVKHYLHNEILDFKENKVSWRNKEIIFTAQFTGPKERFLDQTSKFEVYAPYVIIRVQPLEQEGYMIRGSRINNKESGEEFTNMGEGFEHYCQTQKTVEAYIDAKLQQEKTKN